MCLMGRKAVSHPCSHKGENIKCSKNNQQHLMYMQSLSRWERRNLSHFGLPCAWYRKLPIVCKSQTDRESIRSLPLISYSVYCLEQCILFYSGVVLLDSLCQPMRRVQSRHGRVTRSSRAHRWAAARPLPSLCPIHGCTQTFLWLGSQLLVLCPQCHGLRSGKMHKGTFLGLFLTHPHCPVWNKHSTHSLWKKGDGSAGGSVCNSLLILTQPFSSPSVYKVLKVLKFCQNLRADFNLACTIKTLITGKWFSSREPQITAESLRYW